MKVLVDSSCLYAAYNQNDKRHAQVVASVHKNYDTVLPEVVLVEVVYLLKERSGVPAAVGFLDVLVKAYTALQSITIDDLKRVREIMNQYSSARFDFVDCCIMALAERLNITKIYTFDHRDFSIFQPKHCPHFELLP